MTLDELYKIIENRKGKKAENSYVASLFKKGRDTIVQKVGEEAIEVIISAKSKNAKEVISETADLFFHLLILLSYFNIKPQQIFEELEKRNKIKLP